MERSEVTLHAKDLNQQGVVLAKAGKIDDAIDKFNKAMDLDPMLLDSYKNMGDLYLHIEKYEEAKSFYKKALLIKKDGEIYFQFGNACFLNDEPHEGLNYYNHALSAGYDSDEMLFLMGMAYEHMNDDKMALRYVQKALTKNPSRPDFKVKKINIMLRLGLTDDVYKEVDDLILNDPELYDGYHIKTSLLLQDNKLEEAVEFARKASDRFPEDSDLLFDYANACALSNKLQEAQGLVERAKEMKYYEDSRPRFALLSAQIAAEMGNIDEAIEKCDECISLEKEGELFDEARFMRINLALTKPDFETALSHACSIIEKGGRSSYFYAALYYRPYCQKQLGAVEEANTNFQEAISLYRLSTLENPNAIDAYLYRTMCLKDMEKYDDALEILDFIEKLNDQIAEIYTLRADIYNLSGREGLAKDELEKAYTIKPELRSVFEMAKKEVE